MQLNAQFTVIINKHVRVTSFDFRVQSLVVNTFTLYTKKYKPKCYVCREHFTKRLSTKRTEMNYRLLSIKKVCVKKVPEAHLWPFTYFREVQ